MGWRTSASSARHSLFSLLRSEEARRDPRTFANPLVRGEFGLQFYAAAPLLTSDGYRLGTLCIIDREPRIFSPKQADILDRLSQIVIDEMELRLSAIQAVANARKPSL